MPDTHQFISVFCSDCGHQYKAMMYCKDRLCPQCKEHNYFRLLRVYKPLIRSIPFYRLSQITLTHINFPLLKQKNVLSIQRDFRKLRQTSFWRSRVKGGLAVIECKHASDKVGWNLHIHVLVDASFIPQRELSRQWQKITRHSYVVDVRQEKNSLHAVKHLLKYFLKVPIVSGADVISLRKDFNDAFFRSRNVISFGTLYSAESDFSVYHFKCPMCGSTNGFISEYELSRYRILAQTPILADG